jgi:hypothetical protein
VTATPVEPGYTLVRYCGVPKNLTGIAQVISAGHAEQMLAAWQLDYPEEETVVFDRANAPVTPAHLAMLAASDPAPGARVPRRQMS